MLATEHVETSRRFLADADREYEEGHTLQASEKLWGAATRALIAEMHRRDMKTSGHREMVPAVKQISEELDEVSIDMAFASTRALHANFYHGFMEDYEFAINREHVHYFVNRIIGPSE